MAFDSNGKYYDPTLVNTKKAEAVLKEFASNTGGTQPTATNSQSVPLVKCRDCDNEAVYHFCKDHFVITGK